MLYDKETQMSLYNVKTGNRILPASLQEILLVALNLYRRLTTACGCNLDHGVQVSFVYNIALLH